MSDASEARKAAVESIDRIVSALGGFGGAVVYSFDPDATAHNRLPRGSITVADLRHLIAAARAGVEREAEEEIEAPRCIYCGGECEIEGGDEAGEDTGSYWVVCPNSACGLGPKATTRKAAVEAFLRPAYLPSTSRPVVGDATKHLASIVANHQQMKYGRIGSFFLVVMSDEAANSALAELGIAADPAAYEAEAAAREAGS